MSPCAGMPGVPGCANPGDGKAGKPGVRGTLPTDDTVDGALAEEGDAVDGALAERGGAAGGKNQWLGRLEDCACPLGVDG